MKQILLFVLVLSMAFASLFTVSHMGEPYAGEDNNYTIVVSNAATGLPVANASVTLYKSDKPLGKRMTNAAGRAPFLLHPLETGIVAFSIAKEGFNEYVLFQEITARPAPAQIATPTPAPTAVPAQAPTKLSGYMAMNPSDRGMFLFVMLIAFVCFFSSFALFYKNYVQKEEGAGSGDMAEAFSTLTGWLKRE